MNVLVSGIILRETELDKVRGLVNKGHHLVVLGEPGMGKGELLRELAEDSELRERALHVGLATPARAMLIRLAMQLNRRYPLTLKDLPEARGNLRPRVAELKRILARSSVLEIAKVVSRALTDFEGREGVPCLLLFEGLERATSREVEVLLKLMEAAQCVFAASRLKESHEPLRLGCALVELGPLSQEAIEELIENYFSGDGAFLEDREGFVRRVYRLSGGNPGKALALCKKAGIEGTAEVLDDELAGEGEEEGKRYLDMTPFVFVFSALVMGLRYISLGLDDRMLYVFAGLGFAFFYGMRPFIWRLQRPRSRS
jgi:hypothetical protein